jgi:CheY-like chemotaxis protein
MTAQAVGPGRVDVLIIDDDALMRKSLRGLLETEGYTCAEADDGREAVELARRSNPRCAIVDLVLPGMDGFTVVSRLRADPCTDGMRLHCLTGCVDPEARAHAERVGFDSYLTKPVDPSQLLRAIRGQPIGPAAVVEESGLSLEEACELLDRWENSGCRDLEASYTEGAGFAVRGVWPS